MLVLRGRTPDRFYVGDTEIQIVAVSGGLVTLGFTAPRQVRILREKVKRAIDAAKAAEEMPAAFGRL